MVKQRSAGWLATIEGMKEGTEDGGRQSKLQAKRRGVPRPGGEGGLGENGKFSCLKRNI